VIGFGARTLGEELPKYINSPESPLFAKGKNLYGLHLARGPIRELDGVLVVEGYMDLLALHQAGIRNVVATLGTAVTREHLQRLRRHTPHVIHVFDADEAGERATMRALDVGLETGTWGRVLRLPTPHDPDTYVRKVGAEAFRKDLEGAVPLMEYMVQRVTGQLDVSKLEGKSRALLQILPRIGKLQDRVAMDHYVAMTSQRLGVSEARIHEMLQGKTQPQSPGVEADSAGDDPLRADRLLVQCMLREPALIGALQDEVLDEIRDPRLQGLASRLVRWAAEGEDLRPESLAARIPEPHLAQALADLLAHLDEVEEETERICEECLRHLRRRRLDREIRALGDGIAQARKQKDTSRINALEVRKAQLVVQKKRLGLSA
jgi:DNA primase